MRFDLGTPATPPPRIALIVVGYNHGHQLGRLFASLPAGVAPHQPTLCLVDNASEDDTFAQLERHAGVLGPDAIVERSAQNLGYTGGNNRAFELLERRGSFDFYVLLNPDTTVDPGWLSGLLEPFEAPGVGLSTSVLLLPDGRIDAQGCGIHYLGFGFTLGYQRAKDDPPRRQPSYASGASLAISRRCLEAVQALSGDAQIFWPLLFLYHDDLDLGWRALLAGFRPALAPKSRVVHDHEWPGRSANPRKFFFMERNRFLVVVANYRLPTLLLLAPLLLASEVALRFAGGPYRASSFELARAVLGALGTRAFWARRRRLQARRVRSDRALLEFFAGEIEHPAVAARGSLQNCVSRLGFASLKRVVWW